MVEERDACSRYSQEAESGVMSPEWSVSRCHERYWSLHPCAAGKGSQDRVTPGQMGAVIRTETRENWAKEVRSPLVAAGSIARNWWQRYIRQQATVEYRAVREVGLAHKIRNAGGAEQRLLEKMLGCIGTPVREC